MDDQNSLFTFFIGKKIIDYRHGTPYPLEIFLENGGISAECPWRLHKNGVTAVGSTDYLYVSSILEVYEKFNCISGKIILGIKFYEQVNVLSLEFSEGYQLDLFHDSEHFEGWELYAKTGLSIIS
ncbi:hypothetical protein CEF21_17790 [Bacillus sp. FJAT-42376]|uniref:hypothetical protein n=1 Tax=Bacillus sp. FJAT-42376 TaxID=2014076 RepID=UPI000F4E7E99|nr:hypothetical protein [Bacillus sp. FJAT-42376]AZB44017.1 hypothetical protein CEF21_17790 [Bacillus sp. FJAT-42376]